METAKLNIKQWAEDDRPREKMMQKGASALSNAELLAILIGSGTVEESAVGLMKRVMADCDNRLKTLGRMSLEELTESENDFKSRLIEWCQKNHHTIRFRTTRQENSAANHPLFRSTALIDNMEVGHGSGESKKGAEQQAAYSVSQSFSDETCAALLDKVDRLRLGGESR